jgi:Na+/H+-dicarboxylate symporter
VLGSAATAGTTGGVVMLTLTLSTLGLPLAGVGLLLAVDPIVDMGRTGVNVVGQALVPALVSKQEGILDEEKYNASRAGANLLADDEEALAAAEAADAVEHGASVSAGPSDDSLREPSRTR